MVSVVFRSKPLVLLLFMHCLVLLPMFVRGVVVLGICFVLQHYLSFIVFSNHLTWEVRASCFTNVVF